MCYIKRFRINKLYAIIKIITMKYSFILAFAIAFLGAIHVSSQELMTVKGSIPAEDMQKTLIHEHILVDWIGADSTGYHRWNRDSVAKKALPHLKKIQNHGVKTFFECTPAYLGRDPHLLKMLAEETGMQIVTNTGYYGAVDNKFMPAHARDESAKELARKWIDEFKNGIGESNVRPGFIKIAVAPEDTLSPLHNKIVRAAAKTHKATGLTIVSHTGGNGPAFAQIELLKKHNVSPSAFVWTHAQNGTTDGYLKAAKEGAWISLDHVTKKPENIKKYVNLLTFAKKHNILDKILISHDSGWYSPGEPNGGDFNGYTAIFKKLVPALKDENFTQEEINQLLIQNPQDAYTLN